MDRYDIKDVAKKVKDLLHKKYPDYGFSVTSERGMTDSLYIYWMSADFYPFKEEGEKEIDVNTYWINDENRLVPKALDVVLDINKIAKQYQTSYERGDNHTVRNFYLNIKVGKWDKPFMVVKTLKSTTSASTGGRKSSWEWGDMIRSNNGWTLYNKTLDDGRVVYNLVKEKSTQANKEQWNEIRGELYTETGFKWSPKTQSFQYWGELSKKINYLEILEKLFSIMGKYYGTTTPTSATTSSKQDLTDKSPATAFDIVYRENTEDFEQSNDYTMFAERMSLKYEMNDAQWEYLLKEFEKKDNQKPFVVNESYKSIPDNPKLEYVKIRGSEGFPEYTSLFPLQFQSFKQMNKFIADNLDMETSGGYDKHWIEWKFKINDDLESDRFDIGNNLNPNKWSNIWAVEYLQRFVWDALTSTSQFTKEEYEKSDNDIFNIGKDGLELTKEEFYDIINYFCDFAYYSADYFPKFTTQSSRLQRLKEVYPKLFSIFDNQQTITITAEVIQMKIKALSVLAKYGDELAAKKVKALQILLK